MILNEKFLSVYEELSELNEAKADVEKLIAFAGKDLANRFLLIKDRLKAPENDLYYWIKNKTVDELEQTVFNIENTKSATRVKKDIADEGAKLVSESEHWKIYYITTFEAAQKYGKDTKWCITGINDYGDKYWNQYTDKNIKFYFAIAKQDYNARGTNSKFAFAVYPINIIELYNQQDNQVPLEAIPYHDEIQIPDIDLSKVIIEANCDNCGAPLESYDIFPNPEGIPYCEDCFYADYDYCDMCEEPFHQRNLMPTVRYLDMYYCPSCLKKHVETSEGILDKFYALAQNKIPFTNIDSNTLNTIIKAWFEAKTQHEIRFDAKSKAYIENLFKTNAEAAGINFDHSLFN